MRFIPGGGEDDDGPQSDQRPEPAQGTTLLQQLTYDVRQNTAHDRGSLVGHGQPTSMAPAHQATFETMDLKTRMHAKLMPRKTAAWQRREESLSYTLSGAHGKAL